MLLPEPTIETPPSDLAVVMEDVSKTYRIYARPRDRLLQSFYRSRKHLFEEHEALKPVTLSIKRGETVGIVGANGSGKSTLLQIVCGTLTPTSGRVRIEGRISALLELGAGFNPEFTGRENVFLNASILGLREEEIRAKYEDIVQFSGLDASHLESPVKTYSSGMFVRLAFAVAIAVEPDILVVDEALAVGDEAFQRKCFARIRQLQEQGTAILFVSHASQTVIDICTRAIWFDAGDLMMEGAPKDIIAAYHKLIYAPAAEQPEIRRQILAKGKEPSLPLLSASPPEQEFPESCVSYPRNGGEIIRPRLLDGAGEPARHLVYGKNYRLTYQVKFDQPVEALKYAMFIKTKTGIELAGTVLHAQDGALGSVNAGDLVELSFDFPCHLRPGMYYCNCGVTKTVDGEDVFVHRLVDALHFRILPEESLRGDMEPRGIVDLDIKGSARKI